MRTLAFILLVIAAFMASSVISAPQHPAVTARAPYALPQFHLYFPQHQQHRLYSNLPYPDQYAPHYPYYYSQNAFPLV
ncbi:Hypothetical predicted protein [Cloeon dipterum]|uniref:Uncharacterized protein n=1 Tax=Cloeon dipterum TaxID=197152 RepID=A0A8S1CDJ1_9INSE|nr:Hypothetical predicted protein [Cloeon dipterum]